MQNTAKNLRPPLRMPLLQSSPHSGHSSQLAFGAHEIPYVDRPEKFREASKQESLYLLRDTHWNSAGNSLAAMILEEELARVQPASTLP